MQSYQIQLEQNQQDKLLRVGFNRIQPAPGDRIVKDAFLRLEQMLDSGELTPGGILKIDGPQSIPVAYVIAHKLAHLYEAIAVLDPKIGKRGYKTYIVTITHGSTRYQIGDLIETLETQPERTQLKIVLCGPSRSGKSCFRDGLKRAILGILGAPYPYIITACPDGEGSWHKETYENNETLAISLKPANKSDFSTEYAQEAAQWVKSANQLINIIDVGGIPSPENKIIMTPATHAIILSKDTSLFAEWENLCQFLNLKIIAKIESQLEEKQDILQISPDWKNNPHEQLKQAPLLTGVIHGLNRGEKNLSQRPIIKTLAEVLTYLTKC